ncbi:MAG TPA: hypothetical protein VI796_02275, partial [Candidatus Thermoplasmatota archaeon]|nr:hypothetical protein [Candidatus Thermoplasmatota archaeon]
SLTPAASGTYDFGASSGSISIDLGRGGGRAYDVTAAASSGSVQVGLEDGEDLGEDEDGNRAHVRSRGYDDARIQTTLEASASSGSISVQG